MDITVCVLVLSAALVDVAKAVKCHDCSSWNPYCREKVDEPFESAVAVVECEKTSTCFLKKDESGVINRGCADWWMESQVDIHYEGCQTQHVPWLGEMTWCFCKKDYCNGGSIDMMSQGIYPDVQAPSKEKEWGDYNEDWADDEWTENHVEQQEGSEMDHSDWGQRGHKKTFDDLNPGYLGSAGPRKNSDPKYQLWFWHADSDRPQWEEEQDNWRAPEWVERDDGEGWDFPVTGNVHNHRRGDDVGIISTVPNNVAADDNSEESTTWNWGNGWGHIKPWWLKDDYEDKSTIKPKRWTHPTRAPRFQDDGWAGLPSKWGHGQRDREDMGWGQNSVENVAEHGNDYVDYDNHKDNHNNDDYNNVNDVVDLNQQEFFCWDCYSDSPLCGDSVDTVKAAYLGKTACGNTQKCFVRNDKGVIYRGCADGWTSSVIDTNYVGCRSQEMWDRTVEWCFCTASLCNGDSMQSIKDKYQPPAFEPFKVTESMAENMTSPTTPTPLPSNTTVPFKAAKTDSDHTIQKRSTTSNADNSTVSINFHVEKDTGLPSSTSTLSKATDASTGSTTSTGDWMTVEDGSDDSRKGSGAGNVKPPSERVNGTNYRALFG